MDGAALAAKAGAERLEHGLDASQDLPEVVCAGWVVAGVFDVLGEARRDRALLRREMDPNVDVERGQLGEYGLVEAADGAGEEGQPAHVPIAVLDEELVIDEVEVHGERPVLVRHGRRRETARREVQGYVPPLVHLRRQGEPDLADDLGVEEQRRVGVAPRGNGELGPGGHEYYCRTIVEICPNPGPLALSVEPCHS